MHQSLQVDKIISNTLDWLNSIKNSAKFTVKDIKLDEALPWSFEDGAIRHASHRFFNVVGVKFTNSLGEVEYQPLLEQREIGTLGFIWRRSDTGPEILVQAKIEPGNVGVVQLAPSCQATESNADRVHGGKISPLSDVFNDGEVEVISDSLQSEQGLRFLDKLNRNVLATLKDSNYIPEDVHKWLPVDVVLEMLKINYLFNTDARSVLVCSNWEKLVDRKPFSSSKEKLSQELSESYYHDGLFTNLNQLKNNLKNMRDKIKSPEIVSLHNMTNYEISNFGVFPKNKKPFAVKYIKVQTGYREVKSWNQPIIESAGTGKVVLTCARIDGILHFLFKPVIEPGLINKVELGPSMMVEPGRNSQEEVESNNKGKLIIESWQSEEGGRFYHDKNLYQIVDAGNVYSIPKGWAWLSLKQVSELLKEGGWITNEGRSTLSLIMTYL